MNKVAIVIRTLNSGTLIRDVMDAVSRQSFTDFEVVIVDSGSTDVTKEVLSNYEHTFVDVSNSSFSYGGSINSGVLASDSEFVVCLSHHCIPVHDDWLESLVNAMKDETLAGASGPLIFDLHNLAVGNRGITRITLEDFEALPNRGLTNPNSIIRRELWSEHPFSESLPRCEDQEWAEHFLKRGYFTGIVHDSPVLYKPSFGCVEYAVNTFRNNLAMNRMFGYQPGTSYKALARTTLRLASRVVSGEMSNREGTLAVSSTIGRWAAANKLAYDRAGNSIGRPGGGVLGETRKAIGVADLALNRAKKSMSEKFKQTGNGKAPLRNFGNRDPEKITGSIETFFFVVGDMRSGTSWLQHTLNSHPEVYCRGEGSFFGTGQVSEDIPVYRDATPSLQYALAHDKMLDIWQSLKWNGWSNHRTHELRDLTRLTIAYYLAKEANGTGKVVVGDKSPSNTDYVDEIHELFPNARILHIVRDGRDVAVSLMHHYWRLAKDKGGIFDLNLEELELRDAYYTSPEEFTGGSGRSIFTGERLQQIASRWTRRVTNASEQGRSLFGDNYYEVRYEDLLEKPEVHLSQMFQLLQVSSDRYTVDNCVNQNTFDKLSRRKRGKEDASSFFRKGVSGDWRRVFTENDINLYESIAGNALKAKGYEIGEL